MDLNNYLSIKIRPGAVSEVLVRWAAKAIGAAVDAAAIAVDGKVKAHVRALIMSYDPAGLGLFKHFELCFGRLAQPFDGMGEPRIGGIFDVLHNTRIYLSITAVAPKTHSRETHGCKSVLSLQHSISKVRLFGEMATRLAPVQFGGPQYFCYWQPH